MMKNRLKGIILAIAVVAIIVVNNIGFGSFNLVDARPIFSIDEIGIQERVKRPVGKNYLAGAKYIQGNNFSPAVRVIWDEGIKGFLEANIRGMLSQRPLNKDIKISFETVQIGNSGDFIGFSVNNQDELALDINARGSIKFKTEAASSFSVSFYLTTSINSTLSIGEVTVKDVRLSFNPFTYNISNADEQTVELVVNFFKRKGEFDLGMTDMTSKIVGKRNIFKTNTSNFIKSAIERYAPANILNKP